MSNTLAIILLFLLFVLLGYLAWWSWRQVRHNRSMSDLRADQMGDSEIEREVHGVGKPRTAGTTNLPPVSPSTFGAPIAAGMAAGTAGAASGQSPATSPASEAGHPDQQDRAAVGYTPISEDELERIEPTLKPEGDPAGPHEKASGEGSESSAAVSPVMQKEVLRNPGQEALPPEARLHPSRTYTEGSGRPYISEGDAVNRGAVSSKDLEQDAHADATALKGRKPETLDGPGLDSADNLQAIIGIDHNLERKLNQAGIWHFSQIIRWDDEEIAWVESYLGSTAHVRRDDWQGQAERLEAMNAPKI